jgi:uncharacterized protein (TIGR03083 family)
MVDPVPPQTLQSLGDRPVCQRNRRLSAPEPILDFATTRTAVRAAADACIGLFAAELDGGVAVRGSDWSVAEVAAHVAVASEVYTEYAGGRKEAFVDISDIAGGSLATTSAQRLAEEPERDLGALAARLDRAVNALLAATAACDGREIVTWNGCEITVGALLGIALGEYLLHGRDVAHAVGRPWTISADDARIVLASVLPLLPLLVDPSATSRADVTYDLRVRGGARVGLTIRRGTIAVTPSPGRVECHVSADPVALLLVAYGRQSQWRAVLTGKLAVWGRKPWVGARLTSYLVAP